MSGTLDFWFDYSCPYAYLGSTQVEAVAARSGRELRFRPMLLGGVFKANSTPQNLMNVLSPAKAKHNADDMSRWAEVFGVPLYMPAGHPLRTVEALRATLATNIDPKVIRGFFRAYWVEGRGPSEPDTVRRVLTEAGHDADRVMAAMNEPAIKDELRARTDEAIALGVFGAPAYVVDGKELYWGQDRATFFGGPDIVDRARKPTMAHTLEIYWDFSSPFAYLGSTQAEALAKRTGAKLVWRPMLLGGLFKTIGQVEVPIATWSKAKQGYYWKDMQRWAEHWSVPFQFNTNFPVNSLKAMRVYLALPEARRAAYREAMFEAAWVSDKNISDDGVLKSAIGEGADEILQKTQDAAVKQELIAATQRAADAGVFGAPTWIVDEKELFWGQDRIPLVERALLA